MRFCKYCGKQIEDRTKICPHCGKEVGEIVQKETASKTAEGGSGRAAGIQNDKTKRIKTVVIAAALIGGIALFLSGGYFSGGFFTGGRCQYSGCRNKAVSGSDYCYNHKCVISDCVNRRSGSSNYCYEHAYYDDEEEEIDNSADVAARLRISDIQLEPYGSNYIKATGKITNNSSYTVSFVQIKGSFETFSGKVVDTDWTYAVDSAGLAPGETCKWEMTVKKDSMITNCTVTIIDLNVE